MTGGAFGSMIAQLFHLTERGTQDAFGGGSSRRDVCNICFAGGGGAAGSGVVVIRMEAKEPDPRGVGQRGGGGGATILILGFGPLFPVPEHPLFIGPKGLLGCALVGILAGCLSALLTLSVYAAEDAFQHLKIHWMWWPAIGGLVIGLGGMIFPQALGVGYDTIGGLLQGSVTTKVILGVLLVKWFIWAVSLGSGTSGGVLAPLLMMGGALGGLEAMFLPHEGAGFWPLISMGAILGGTMRSPLTGIVFRVRTDTRRERIFAAAGGGNHRAWFHGTNAETIDPDGKGGATRIPLEQGIQRGPAGVTLCARSDAEQNIVELHGEFTIERGRTNAGK